MNLRNKIRSKVWYEIGDGTKINIWHDRWHMNGPLDDIIPFKKRYEARLSEQLTVAEAIIDGNWVWPEQWSQQFHSLTNLNVPMLTNGKEDKIMWIMSNGEKGKFSIRSVWDAFILRLSLLGKLPTQDRIMSWNSQVSLKCPLCTVVNDSHEHLFFKCPFSEEIWNKVKAKANKLNWDGNWRNVVSVLANERCNNSIYSVLYRMVVATSSYFIWSERNMTLFNNSQRDSQSLLNGILDSIKLQLMCLKVRKSATTSKVSKDWEIQMNFC